MLDWLIGPSSLFLYDTGDHTPFTKRGLLDNAAQDTPIKDSIKKIKDVLSQVPEGKTSALVIGTKWKWGAVPVIQIGLAHRMANGWEIAGDALISNSDKSVDVRALRTW